MYNDVMEYVFESFDLESSTLSREILSQHTCFEVLTLQRRVVVRVWVGEGAKRTPM